MTLPAQSKVVINAPVTGQIAVGNDIEQTQNIYNLKIGEVHGGVLHLVTPENMPSAQPRPVPPLPRDFPGLLGRAAEVFEAKTALEAGQLVECYGETGIGKTVLLRHLARRLDPQVFPDGIIYWSVGGRSYEDVLQALFQLFYTTKIPYIPTPARVQHYMEGKQALLIFDDLDLTRQEVEKLMVEVAPRCTFNLASQKRHLVGEGKGVRLKGLPLDAALVLMERTLGRELTLEEQSAAQHLHTVFSGHPLRLLQKVAQVQEGGYTLMALAQQVRAPADADQGTVQDAEKRPEEDRKMLALLALMGGKPVHAQHLAVLAGLTDAEPALHAMAQKGLVGQVGLRYRVSENLMQPLQAWDLKPMLEQALEYFASWAQQQRDTPGRIEWEAEALMQLLKRAVEAQRWNDVLRLGHAIEGALALSGQWGAWEQVLQQYLQAAKAEEDKKATAFALHQMGTRALCLNDAAEAKTRLTEAFHLREALGDKIGAAVTQANLDLLTFPPGPSTDGSGQTDPSSGLMETIKGASVAVKGAIVGIPPLIIGGLLILMLLQIKPPADLSISPLSVSAVSLSWKDKNDAKTPFIIERRTGGGMFAVIDSVAAGAMTFTDTSFVPNTTYVYRVGAQKSNGKLVYSEEYPVLTPPTTPTSLTANPLSDTTLTLAWQYPDSIPLPAFKVERFSDGGFGEIAEVAVDTLTFTDEGLAANTLYRYQVRAFNDSGNSGYTNVDSARTRPAPPSGLTAENITQASVVLNWQDNSPNPSATTIERRSGSGDFRVVGSVAAGTLTFTDQGLATNTRYIYQVAAQSSDDVPVYSKVDTVLTLPAKPTTLAAGDIKQTSVTLNWQDVNPRPVAFRIERRLGSGQYRRLGTVRQGTTYTDQDLLPNTPYTFRVRAFNATGSSDFINTQDVLTLPVMPSGLSATAASARTITLSWQDNSPNPSASKIERSSGNEGFQEIATVAAGTMQYTHQGLSSNTNYTYRVRAFNQSGDSGFSNEADALTPPVTPTDLAVQVLSLARLTLTWGYPDVNRPAVKIERRSGNEGFKEIITVPAGAVQYTDPDLSANTRYTYRVMAFNQSGDSEFSNEASALTPPVAPNNLVVEVGSQTQLALSWNYRGANRPLFKIERRTDGSSTFREIATEVSGTQYTNQRLAANTGYTYRVRTFNDGGASEPSNEMRGLTLPAAPTNLTISASSTTTVTLRWRDNNPTPAAFKIGRFDNSGAFREIDRVAAGTSQYTNERLSSSTTNTYRVWAFNESGDSGYSNAVRATTLRPVGLSSMTLAAEKHPDGSGRFLGSVGKSITGTVVLDGPAPASGVRVTLSSNTQVAQFPSSLTILAGRTQDNFTITILRRIRVSPEITLTASYNGVSRTVTVWVQPSAN